MIESTTPIPAGRWRRRRAVAVAAAALLAAISSGCAVVGFGLDSVAGDDKEVEVEAEYRRLEGTSVAVMVHAGSDILYRHTNAPMLVARAVSARIADKVPMARLLEPGRVAEFQAQNPHWVPYGEVMEQLGVDRLVVIDVADYTTHDPENTHAWRGVLSANIRVAERESSDTDMPVYGNSVRIRYPDHPVPLLESDEGTIELGLLNRFSSRVARLFHDHEAPPQ